MRCSIFLLFLVQQAAARLGDRRLLVPHSYIVQVREDANLTTVAETWPDAQILPNLHSFGVTVESDGDVLELVRHPDIVSVEPVRISFHC